MNTDNMQKGKKIVIIGAGHVGSHCALSLVYTGEADEIVLIDIDRAKAEGQAKDISDAAAGLGNAVKVYAGDYADAADADVMIMAAGRSRRPGETRLDMLDDSVRMIQDIIPGIKKSGFHGFFISISNPADVICEYIRRAVGFDRTRAFSTGTSLDTFRLYKYISQATGYSTQSIQGFCMGEHGDSHVPVYSRVTLNGKSFFELREERPDTIGKIDLEQMEKDIKWEGFAEVEGKGCTEFGIAAVASKLVKAIFHDQKLIWPVSVALEGEYGEENVAAGVPCVIGKNGVEEIVKVELTADEAERFHQSCGVIRSFLDRAAEVR